MRKQLPLGYLGKQRQLKSKEKMGAGREKAEGSKVKELRKEASAWEEWWARASNTRSLAWYESSRPDLVGTAHGSHGLRLTLRQPT